jgi:predicted metal-dependent phosphotriesterase family hydrolase
MLYQYLKNQGFSESEIDQMAKVNPAKLLGL